MSATHDIDELFICAQLTSESANDAARLVEQAVQLRSEGSTKSASALILSISRENESEGNEDILTKRRLLGQLEHVVPKVFSRLKAARRIAVREAFLTTRDDASERAIFVMAVRRGLEDISSRNDAAAVSESDVAEALERYLENVLAPTPIALKSVLESRYPSAPGSRAAEQSPTTPPKRNFAPRLARAILLIMIASAIGTWIAYPSDGDMEVVSGDLFEVIAAYEAPQEPTFRSSEATQVERFLLDRLDKRMIIPQFENGSLLGVSIEEVAPGLQIPAVIYSDLIAARNLVVYIFDYEDITRIESSLSVNDSILAQIAEEHGLDIWIDGDESRVSWRNRDDIYLLVTLGDASETRLRFSFD